MLKQSVDVVEWEWMKSNEIEELKTKTMMDRKYN